MSTTEITLIHRLRLADAEHSLLFMITTFGTAADLTVEESIEAFDPADRRTAEALHEIDRAEHTNRPPPGCDPLERPTDRRNSSGAAEDWRHALRFS